MGLWYNYMKQKTNMTDKLKSNNLKEIFLLFVDGLPALDSEEKDTWRLSFEHLTEDECLDVMNTLFEQSLEFIERAKVELRSKPEARGELAAMERQAKTLLAEINADLIALHLKPLH